MTTPQLKRLYFPAWNAAFRANWSWSRGVLTRTAGDTLWNVPAEETAQRIAAPEYRGITPDDLRHAVNALAIRRARAHRAGQPEDAIPLDLRHTSSEDLDDRCDLSLGLFLAYCDLLADDTYLGVAERQGGATAWTHPETIEREYMLRVIGRRCVEGYASKLSREIYGQPEPERLNARDLAGLYRTLGQRRHAWRSADDSLPTPQSSPALCPF